MPITEALGDRIFASAFDQIEIVQENARRLRLALSKQGLSDRRADHIGTLLAGYVFLTRTGCGESIELEVADEVAREYLADSDELKEAKNPNKDDSQLCLDHLLFSQVQVYHESPGFGEDVKLQAERISIQELYERADKDTKTGHDANKNLQRYGMKRVKDKLCVAYRHPELAKIFHGTHWHSWGRALVRLDDASESTVKLHGKATPCVKVRLNFGVRAEVMRPNLTIVPYENG